jgi:hypothetical protein
MLSRIIEDVSQLCPAKNGALIQTQVATGNEVHHHRHARCHTRLPINLSLVSSGKPEID